MKRKHLILGTSLLVLGLLLFGGTMTVLKWDFSRLTTVKYETNTYEIQEDFSDILITSREADIVLLPAEDGVCKVTCVEEQSGKHAVTVHDRTLSIKHENTKKWYQYLSIGVKSPGITIFLPMEEYGALTATVKTGSVELSEQFSFTSTAISTTTGRITLDGIQTGSLALTVSTGKITLSGVTAGDTRIAVSTGDTFLAHCKLASLVTEGGTGDLSMQNTIVDGTLTAKRTTGDIKIEGCDASEIVITTDTGDVSAAFLTDKIVFAKTDTGKTDIPKSTSGDRCEIKTDTGDITVTVE